MCMNRLGFVSRFTITLLSLSLIKAHGAETCFLNDVTNSAQSVVGFVASSPSNQLPEPTSMLLIAGLLLICFIIWSLESGADR